MSGLIGFSEDWKSFYSEADYLGKDEDENEDKFIIIYKITNRPKLK